MNTNHSVKNNRLPDTLHNQKIALAVAIAVHSIVLLLVICISNAPIENNFAVHVILDPNTDGNSQPVLNSFIRKIGEQGEKKKRGGFARTVITSHASTAAADSIFSVISPAQDGVAQDDTFHQSHIIAPAFYDSILTEIHHNPQYKQHILQKALLAGRPSTRSENFSKENVTFDPDIVSEEREMGKVQAEMDKRTPKKAIPKQPKAYMINIFDIPEAIMNLLEQTGVIKKK
jgi:hypothetical protein